MINAANIKNIINANAFRFFLILSSNLLYLLCQMLRTAMSALISTIEGQSHIPVQCVCATRRTASLGGKPVIKHGVAFGTIPPRGLTFCSIRNIVRERKFVSLSVVSAACRTFSFIRVTVIKHLATFIAIPPSTLVAGAFWSVVS